MKKIFLLIAFLVSTMPAFSSVKIGDLYYNLDESNNTAEVTYYIYNSTDNNSYVSGALSIPATVSYEGSDYSVTSIGDKAFYYCSKMTSIIIPYSVTDIAQYAFAGCSGLIKVALPKNGYSFYWPGGHLISYGSDALIEDGFIYSADKREILFVPLECSGFYEIHNSITSIGEGAFYGCSGLTSIEIGNSVTTIGNSAFENCSGLTSVEIPNSVTSIGRSVFEGCSGLTSVEIPNSVTSIGDSVFRGCSGLTSVEIPNSVTEIDNAAFYGCSGLTSMEIPNSVTEIGNAAFWGCNGITSLTINDGEDKLELSYNTFDSGLFSDCPIERLYLGRDLSYSTANIYGYSPFYNIKTLKEVIIGNSVTEIGGYAFGGCSGLTNIVIGKSVTEIGYWAFNGCTAIKHLKFVDGETILNLGYNSYTWNSVGKGLFADCPIETLYLGRNLSYNSESSYGYSPFYNIKTLKELEIGNSVTTIGVSAFRDCSGLKSVVIPNSVTSIGNSAFSGCSGLIKSAYPKNLSNPFNYGVVISYLRNAPIENGIIYSEDKRGILFVPLNYDGVYKISNSVTSIRKSAFQGCNGLTSIEIGNSVTEIESSAFQDCNGLTSVVIPNSVTSIGNSAFSGCSKLTNLIFNAENCTVCGSNSSPAFPSNITSLTIGEEVKEIPDNAFYGITHLTSLVIPNSVTSIGNFAFEGCSGLTSLVIPNSVTSIGTFAFEGCSGLRSLEIPNSVTSIGNSAFYGCNELTNLIFNADNCTACGSSDYPAFPSNITSLTIGKDVKEIPNFAFCGLTNMTSVVIPNSVTSIGNFAFKGCSNLTRVEIGNSVNSINSSAFQDCNALASVVIPNSVTYIGKDAFEGCLGLIKSAYPNNLSNPFNYGYVLSYDSDAIIEGGIIFSADKHEILFVPLECSGFYEIHNLITSIGEGAFYSCSGLTSVGIPNSVTEIGNSAFSSCSGLKSVVIPNSVTSIGNSAFSGCDGLTSIEIPNSVTSIGSSAFSNCNKLKLLIFNAEYCIKCGTSDYPAFPPSIIEIQIGNNVKNIPDYAFYGCLRRKTGDNIIEGNKIVQIFDKGLGFPEGSSNASNSAITYIASDTQIPYSLKGSYINSGYLMINGKNYDEAYIEWSLDSPMEKLIMTTSGSGSLNIQSKVNVYANDKILVSGLSVNERNTTYTVLIPLEYRVPGTRYKVESDSRSYNQQFSSFQYLIEEGYKGGNSDENTNMICLSIPNSVSSIGKSAFKNCTLLGELKIPVSVTSIGSSAFDGCILSEITLESEIPPSYYSPFSGYAGKATLIIPDDADINAYLLSDWRNFLNIVQENGDQIYLASDDVFEYRFIESLGEAYLIPASRYSRMSSASIPDRVVADKNGVESFYYVTGISADAFKDCSNLTQIKLPSNCEVIGDNAFNGCRELSIINIPSSVISIGNSAFEGCSGLTNIAIGKAVTNIGSSAFDGCTALSRTDISDLGAWCSIIFGNSLSNPLYFARHLYLNDDEVVDLKIPDTVSSISDYAFCHFKGLVNLTIPNSVKAIGPNSFYSCPIQSLNIDCQNIENWFSGLTSLEILTLGENVSSIGESAFANCSGLKSVKIPNSVSSIGSYAFQRCSGLTNLTISNSITSIGEGTFEGCSGLTNVVIPNSVTSIGESGFRNCSGLASVEIGNSVTSIGNYAFENCNGLTSVEVPNSVTEIGDYAFENCSGLTSVEIGNSVTSIGNYAFENCNGLTSVEIPNSVTEIGRSAFSGCNGLTSVKIGNSVTTIAEKAFQDCSLLKSLEIPYSVIRIGNEAFRNIAFDNCSLEDGVEILSWDSTNNISATNLYVGRNTEGMITYSNIENLEIGAFVESIPANRFNKASLSSLIINPGSGVVIEDGAFQRCNKLGDITLPEDIAEIGANAFSGTALRNIIVPNGIIGASAFAGCNLDNIIIGAGVESIGEKAFDGSNSLNAVYATPTTPPMAENNTFSYYEAQLYVPEEAIDTYYNFTRCWYRFNGKPLVMPEKIVVEGPTDVNGKPGETLQLAASITPANVTLDRVLWRSTNTAVATVDNNGLVTFHDFLDEESLMENGDNAYCEIIASTLYEDSPIAIVRIEPQTSSIEYLNSEDFTSGMRNVPDSGDIYTLQGVCLKRGASQNDIDALAPGVYIIGGKKVIVK